ncbi:hypothetical protein [Sphingobacterium chuzhouense]|uniref:Uncharacterized protein n=1 Tax=Sphingobacterium chuzhouense TaxID=1742264 RepID=A0ABR7XR43_9SPHI|nr:hypothetical protein [Sphingobacterium chuzhouense]MBD1421608.1 hypothetical protein [Sphingobacterium chuzhouense]
MMLPAASTLSGAEMVCFPDLAVMIFAFAMHAQDLSPMYPDLLINSGDLVVLLPDL